MDRRPDDRQRAEHFDVIIVGAGLSGVGAACHLEMNLPGKRYVILEGRAATGGTWDLFRYPGIRSDSDMYTLGYSFRPWTHPKAIADGPAILEYIRETAAEHGVDRHIRHRHRVVGARWSTDDARWTIEVRRGEEGERAELTCNFLFVCAGYYDYDEGYTPQLPGRDRFQGRIVHPQQWPEDLDYDGKRVVVIGSGATAVTLVPALARRAAHVTMLQRSPTYIVSVPAKDRIAQWVRRSLPGRAAYSVTRWKNVALGMALYSWCRRFPRHAKRVLVGQVRKLLGDRVDVSTHFTPYYDPWDQRLCLVPDDDLFDAIRAGAASVVTDHIETFTERGILLRSGEELEADIVVTATGLKLKVLGGLELEVDGRPVRPAETLTYKGTMLSGVPNLAMAVGYTNASWTLKCDLSSQYVCRLLEHMDARGYDVCVPRPSEDAFDDKPLIDLASGYVRRSVDQLPKQGASAPWRLYQNYVLDRLMLRHGRIEDGAMELTRSAGGGRAREPAERRSEGSGAVTPSP